MEEKCESCKNCEKCNKEKCQEEEEIFGVPI